MTVWVFHLDSVTEYPEPPPATDHYYLSILYCPVCQTLWWENDGSDWIGVLAEEVPSNHRLMALLLT